MMHCGKEKGPNLDPFPSHNAALSNNQCPFLWKDWILMRSQNIIPILEDNINNLQTAPLGTILAWVPKPTKGQKTPDLNSVRRFLRGGKDSDALKMEGHQIQQHKHNVYDPGHTHDFKDSFASRYGFFGNQGTWIFSNAIQPHPRTTENGRTNLQVS